MGDILNRFRKGFVTRHTHHSCEALSRQTAGCRHSDVQGSCWSQQRWCVCLRVIRLERFQVIVFMASTPPHTHSHTQSSEEKAVSAMNSKQPEKVCNLQQPEQLWLFVTVENRIGFSALILVLYEADILRFCFLIHSFVMGFFPFFFFFKSQVMSQQYFLLLSLFSSSNVTLDYISSCRDTNVFSFNWYNV